MDLPTAPAAVGGSVDGLEMLVHNQGNAATGGIWRVSGSFGTVILKVARPPGAPGAGSWQTSDDPRHWNYWKREVIAYASGLAETAYAAAGIVPPVLRAIHDRPDGSVELWLRDEPGTPGMALPTERLGEFAGQLGLAQAGWAGRVPAQEWLSRAWLRQYLAEGPGRFATAGDEEWGHPTAAVWPANVRTRLRRLWAERDALLRSAEAEPRTLCHLDVWPMNLLASGHTSVLLDWSFVGEGGLGEDAANLIVDSVADGLIDVARLPEIVASVSDRYVEGLRDGGWVGSSDSVRRAIRLFAVAKYAWLGPATVARVVRNPAFGHGQYSRDASGEEAMLRLRPLVTMLADWADDAR